MFFFLSAFGNLFCNACFPEKLGELAILQFDQPSDQCVDVVFTFRRFRWFLEHQGWHDMDSIQAQSLTGLSTTHSLMSRIIF